MKKVLFYLLYLIVISLVLLEVGVRVLTKKNDHGYEFFMDKPWRYMLPLTPQVDLNKDVSVETGEYRVYSPKLGWDIGVLGADTPLYYSDDRGLRCSESQFSSHNFMPHKDTFDIICIGNSFTHCDAVKFEDGWPYLLQQQTGRSVLNYGVGGYGIDQATLKYEYGPYRSNIVILGLVSGDLERAVSTVYNFYIGGNKSKPKFEFSDNKVSLINSPAAVGKELQENFDHYDTSALVHNIENYDKVVLRKDFLDFSYLYRLIKSIRHQKEYKKDPIYRTDDARLDYCVRIIKHLQDVCEQRNAKLVVLLLSNFNNFSDMNSIQDPWALFRKKLNENNISLLDPTTELYSAYKREHSEVIHPVEGVHYSPQGNAIVAKFVANHIREFLDSSLQD